MNEFVIFTKIISLGVASIVLFYVAYRIFRGSSNEYRRNREKSETWYAPFTGRLNAFTSGGRDYRVAAGIALNLETKQWECQGTLSEEALDSMLKR